jgi:hypothetical protein
MMMMYFNPSFECDSFCKVLAIVHYDIDMVSDHIPDEEQVPLFVVA